MFGSCLFVLLTVAATVANTRFIVVPLVPNYSNVKVDLPRFVRQTPGVEKDRPYFTRAKYAGHLSFGDGVDRPMEPFSYDELAGQMPYDEVSKSARQSPFSENSKSAETLSYDEVSRSEPISYYDELPGQSPHDELWRSARQLPYNEKSPYRNMGRAAGQLLDDQGTRQLPYDQGSNSAGMLPYDGGVVSTPHLAREKLARAAGQLPHNKNTRVIARQLPFNEMARVARQLPYDEVNQRVATTSAVPLLQEEKTTLESLEAEESKRFERQAGGGEGHHVDYGAHTGPHGSFGWYADFPVHSH